jgi:hypothetical protein
MTNILENRKKEIEKIVRELKIVDIEKLETKKGQALNLLKIGGIGVRPYLSQTEAKTVETFMIKVMVVAIMTYETGKKTDEKIEGEFV